MLFKNINEILSQKLEKKFFIEKIIIINELIKKYCLNNNINFAEITLDKKHIIYELKLIGIIENKSQLVILKNIIGENLYTELIRSLSFYHKNKKDTSYILKQFYNSYRKKLQKYKQENKSSKIIDLFCGAGGFSSGFLKENYQIELANDIDQAAIETYKFNHPSVPTNKIVCGDIISLVNNLDKNIDTKIDVIIGGPPCQSFSTANQQRIINDPRNILYKYFVKAAEKIRPKFIIMENVKGMKRVASQVIEDFKNIDYIVEYKLYNSYDFSVPQNRIRIIYIGIEKDFSEKYNITPNSIFNDINNEIMNKPKYVLKDALENIKSLQCAQIKNITEEDCEISGKKIDFENEHIQNEYIKLINDNKSKNFLFNHKARFNSKNDQKIYSTLQQGSNSTCESIKDIMPYSHRNHIFKDKYFKLVETLPSKTITAHMKMDCHSHIHPTQVRSLTPREAARIQSFPDNYLFLGPYLNTYRQIGNAVPPLMSKVFAKVIKQYLK